MHSEEIQSFAKKLVNAILDNLAIWRGTNRHIAINWQYWRPIFDFRLPNRHIGGFWLKKSPKWRFLGQKSPKKKYASKCLKLPNSSRNAIKIFECGIVRKCAELCGPHPVQNVRDR